MILCTTKVESQAGDVAQLVEYLPSIHKVLGSVPSIAGT